MSGKTIFVDRQVKFDDITRLRSFCKASSYATYEMRYGSSTRFKDAW